MIDDAKPPTEDKLRHPCFPQPSAGTTRVWRYLDLAKLVWLLERKQLYLSRLDLLNDPHEGSIPSLAVLVREQQCRELGAEHAIPQIAALNERNRFFTYVSCWHLGNAESEAMWRLYCGDNSGVAIQTTYAALVRSLESDPHCYIGTVTYIDYEIGAFPQTNVYYPMMHKRASFAHEQEVRIIKSDMKAWDTPGQIGEPGIAIPWDPSASVDAIYVNPYAPEFYRDVVQSVVRQFAPALTDRVQWSAMRAAPSY